MGKTIVLNHPLILHKLTILRQSSTTSKDFRELVTEITTLMGYEVTRDFETVEIDIETPMRSAKGVEISGKKVGLVPILRAGLGMVDGFLNLIPSARVGHVGLYRDPDTLEPVEYYSKLPKDIAERQMIILDPMLATGGSLAAAIDIIKKSGAMSIKVVSLLAAPEGLEKVRELHDDIDIYVASIDEKLNDHGYIIPGLGDAGDRLFGTK